MFQFLHLEEMLQPVFDNSQWALTSNLSHKMLAAIQFHYSPVFQNSSSCCSSHWTEGCPWAFRIFWLCPRGQVLWATQLGSSWYLLCHQTILALWTSGHMCHFIYMWSVTLAMEGFILHLNGIYFSPLDAETCSRKTHRPRYKEIKYSTSLSARELHLCQ